MNRSIFASAALALTVFAVGCASTATESVSGSESQLGAGVTQVVDTASGKVFATAAGLSLYTFDNDTTSESTCYNGCAVTWPPLTVTAIEAYSLAAPFATTTRTDGALQVTLDGHPVYRFKNDAVQGDIKGDGLGGVWHLARPEAKKPAQSDVQIVQTAVGSVLGNKDGMSLYTFDNDTTSESTCYNGCAVVWPAVIATDPKALVAPYGVTVRTDGTNQITFDGHPLYTYKNDEVPGDINGDGLGGVWHLARPTK